MPGHNYTFEIIRNWYDLDDPAYTPEFLRASFFSISWKSKIGNSDMGSNFFTDTKVDIKKGDIIIREDGEIYIIDWKVQRKVNVQETQAKDCNIRLCVYRDEDEVLDDRGFVIIPAQRALVVPSIPCVMTPHTGRPDYPIASGTPGIHADTLFDGWVQWNPITQKLRVGDEFVWRDISYRMVNVESCEVEIDGEFGLIYFNVKRVAGGMADA